MIKANDKNRRTWLEVPENSDFPIQNIPFGIAKANNEIFVATRIGDTVINIYKLAQMGCFSNIDAEFFNEDKLNDFMLLGKQATRDVRNEISDVFNSENEAKKSELKDVLVDLAEVEMLMPISIGDYTDFYSSEQHAFNVGCLFRDPDNALLPNWKHIPVGYHGRASSVIPSGMDFHRPKGQKKPPTAEVPVFGPSNLLDFELETAFFTYEGKPLGDSISTEEADDYIFGMALF
jgi:fumarylacetoacetase